MESEPTWDGAIDRDAYNDAHVRDRDDLTGASRKGNWQVVLRLLRDADKNLSANHWRLGGRSWFTPLHQAAWHGAPAEVVAELVDLGASRVLTTAAGHRAADIAREKGHRQLVAILEPVVRNPTPPDVLDALDGHLSALVESRIRPHLTVRLRPLPAVVLTEREPGSVVWFPIPGMVGGFAVRLETGYLDVKSWSRVVGGSGQAHVLTPEGSILVAEGFV